jgi:hypothetical protein
VASFVQCVTVPLSHALLTVVQFGSADAIMRMLDAQKEEINGLAQGLNAAKLKLMMMGGRHVFMGFYGKVIMTNSYPLLFPGKKGHHASINAASILTAINQSYSVIVSHSLTDYAQTVEWYCLIYAKRCIAAMKKRKMMQGLIVLLLGLDMMRLG